MIYKEQGLENSKNQHRTWKHFSTTKMTENRACKRHWIMSPVSANIIYDFLLHQEWGGISILYWSKLVWLESFLWREPEHDQQWDP